MYPFIIVHSIAWIIFLKSTFPKSHESYIQKIWYCLGAVLGMGTLIFLWLFDQDANYVDELCICLFPFMICMTHRNCVVDGNKFKQLEEKREKGEAIDLEEIRVQKRCWKIMKKARIVSIIACLFVFYVIFGRT